MPHTHTSLLIHCVFSTKDRVPLVKTELKKDLWAYIGGIARAKRIKPVGIGGIEDHVHALLAIPANLDVSKRCNCSRADRRNGFARSICRSSVGSRVMADSV